jgi:glycosyltransferase involved in cell wall biosynthesis
MPAAPCVLFLPIVEWAFRTQRPQQLARCFARAGYRVYYPGLRPRAEPLGPRLIESGVWAVDLAGRDDFDPYLESMSAVDVERAVAGLADWGERHSLNGVWVVAQLPAWRALAEAVRRTFAGAVAFDCMDDFAAFGDHGDLGDEERALAQRADLVIASSRLLYERLAPLNPRALLLNNGCDPEHFGPASVRAARSGPPVVGFFGGIHEWFDAPLVAELARLRPTWHFRLIGDTYGADLGDLPRLPNVSLLGEAAYEALPRLASQFDAGIVPFRDTPLTRAADPVKAYEMLAAGLPVVATDLPELRRLAPPVALAATAEEFAARIEDSLAEPPEAARRRREFARRHSWVERFVELLRTMDGVRQPQPSPTEPGASLADLGALPPPAVESRELRATIAALQEQRASLVEQRDRVDAEAHRLSSELERVEGERLRLERELRSPSTLTGRLRTLLSGRPR